MLTKAMVWKVVDRATALLAGRGWTRHVCARNAKGTPVSTTDRTADSFCGYGALVRAEHELGVPYIVSAHPNRPMIADYNNNFARNKWDVIRRLEEDAERICATLPE